LGLFIAQKLQIFAERKSTIALLMSYNVPKHFVPFLMEDVETLLSIAITIGLLRA